MRKILFINIILFSINTFSQKKIDFDLLTIYNYKNGPNLIYNVTEMILTNSKDSLVSMTIKRNNKDNKLYGILHNTKEHISHFFYLINDKDDILNSNNLDYKFSFSYSKSKCRDSDAYFEVVNLTDNPNFNAKIIKYENKRKKVILSNLFINKINSELKYFNNFKRGYLHHFDNCQKINMNFNSLVNKAEFQNDSKKVYEKVELISNEPINLTIVINKVNNQSSTKRIEFLKNYF